MLNGCWVHPDREYSTGCKVRKCGFTSQLIQTVAVLSLSPFYLNCKVRVILTNNAYHIGWL